MTIYKDARRLTLIQILRLRRRSISSQGQTDCLLGVRLHINVYPFYSSTYRPHSFGNQGAAQAQNLRDSGIPNEKILIANREDSYVADAKSKGFIVEHDFGKAASVADCDYNCHLLLTFTHKSHSVVPFDS